VTHDTAMLVSSALAAEGVAHTVEVGYHPDHNPPVQCRVDVRVPRRISGGLSAAVRKLEEIGEQFGLVLETALMGDGLTYSTPGTRRPWQVEPRAYTG